MFETIAPKRAESTSGLFAGEISRAPGDYDESATVMLTDFDDDLEFGPCKWMPRYDAPHIPSEGDEVLVAIAPDAEPWIVAWWPHG